MKKILKAIKRFINGSKIGLKLVGLAVLVALSTSLVFGIVVYAYLSANALHSTNYLMSAVVAQYGKNIENTINELERISFNIVLNENVIRLLRGGMTDSKTYSVWQDVQNSITEYSNFRNDILGIYLYSENGEVYESRLSKTLKSGYKIIEQPWYIENCDQKKYQMVFQSDADQFAVPKEFTHISFVKNVYDFASGEKLGVIEMALRSAAFKSTSVTGSRDSDDGFSLYIIDFLGQYRSVFGIELYEETIAREVSNMVFLKNDTEGSWVYTDNGANYLVSHYNSASTGMSFFAIRKTNLLVNDMGVFVRILVIVGFCLSIFLALFIGMYVSKRIFAPLQRLQETMKRVTLDNLNERVDLKSSDEVGELGTYFNKMISNLDEQVQINCQLQHERELLKEESLRLELDALQSQIKPHFLYNALEIISMTARKNEDVEAQKLTVAMGRLLRAGLLKNSTLVSLSSELDHVKSYIEFQNMFFNQKIVLQLEILEELMNHLVVKLILQPLVENSIKHKATIISIYACKKEKCLIIKVIDNGEGMSGTTMQAINEDLRLSRHLTKYPECVGLANTNMRIQLSNRSNSFGIHVESSDCNGTTIVITLPEVRELNNNAQRGSRSR
jgi:two-component system sensor histidine kinase YesM